MPSSIHTYGLHELGYTIFLDRYALKDLNRQHLQAGDTVVAIIDKRGSRKVGVIVEIEPLTENNDIERAVKIELLDGSEVTVQAQHVDRPIELDPAQTARRVARGIAQVEANESKVAEWEEKFAWLLSDWKFVPGGRILTAAGSDQSLSYFNCFVIQMESDSRGGVLRTLAKMAEIMSRGGGVGVNISTLRPRHAYVKGVNGRSSGSVSWGGLFSYVTGLIEQAGSRRGALMLILNDTHPDLLEFIDAKRTAGQITNANISVGISDAFMQAVKNDGQWTLRFPDTQHPAYDTEWDGVLEHWEAKGYPSTVFSTLRARDLWNKIIESAWASAEPGVWFRDRSNKLSNSWYYPEGYLNTTNPCVTGDTLVYTNKGLIPARDLFEQETEIEATNDGRFGYEPTTLPASRVFYTGTKPVFKLRTKEGYTVRATENHQIMTPRGWVALGDLKPEDKIHILNRKGGFGIEGSLELGRVIGWYTGDGTATDDRVQLLFFGEKKQELAPLFAQYVEDIAEPLTIKQRYYGVAPVATKGRDESRVRSTRLYRLFSEYGLVEEKLRVPAVVFQGTEDMQRGYLQALFTADGQFSGNLKKGGAVRLTSVSTELLEGVQQLLLNFGVASRLYLNRQPAGAKLMPDGHGGQKEYTRQACHELHIGKANLATFADEIGFLLNRKQSALTNYLASKTRQPNAESFTATILSIEPDGVEEVFDLTVPDTHAFVGNGIVLHNCAEQPLPANAICNLGALNLARFYNPVTQDVDWDTLIRCVEYGVRFLDNVIDANPYFMDDIENQQMSERRIGLGIMGLGELLIRMGLRYGSEESLRFINRLMGQIASVAYATSSEIAQEKGSFPKFEADKFLKSGFMQGMPEYVRRQIREHGMRNVTVLTVAPTGTTGTMVNTSTGVEPFFSWVYYRKGRLGVHEENVPLVQEWYQANPEADHLPDYFVTAMELSPEEHVNVQAAVQRWVDSAISKTCNVPNSYTVEETRRLYELMYTLGCKGGTIYRDGSRDEQVLMTTPEIKPAPYPPLIDPNANGTSPRPNVVTTTITHQEPNVYTINAADIGYPITTFNDRNEIATLKSGDTVSPSIDVSSATIMTGSTVEYVSVCTDPQCQAEHMVDGVLTCADCVNGQTTSPQEKIVILGAETCPVCEHQTLVNQDGCALCQVCYYSKCDMPTRE